MNCLLCGNLTVKYEVAERWQCPSKKCRFEWFIHPTTNQLWYLHPNARWKWHIIPIGCLPIFKESEL